MSVTRRGVTREYVWGVILATDFLAVSVIVAAWGLLALATSLDPVMSEGVPRWVAPALVVVALGVLTWSLWQQALTLLRGRRAPAWQHIVIAALAAYLLWCLGGVLGGMAIEETWVSPFAALLIPVWALAALLFWLVLARRVYTDRPSPRWPWERKDPEG